MGLKPRFFIVVSIIWPMRPVSMSPWMLSIAAFRACSAAFVMLFPSGLNAAVNAVSVT